MVQKSDSSACEDRLSPEIGPHRHRCVTQGDGESDHPIMRRRIGTWAKGQNRGISCLQRIESTKVVALTGAFPTENYSRDSSVMILRERTIDVDERLIELFEVEIVARRVRGPEWIE